jgi:hypothetical protein
MSEFNDSFKGYALKKKDKFYCELHPVSHTFLYLSETNLAQLQRPEQK